MKHELSQYIHRCKKCHHEFYMLNDEGLCQDCSQREDLDVIEKTLKEKPLLNIIGLSKNTKISRNKILTYIHRGFISYAYEPEYLRA